MTGRVTPLYHQTLDDDMPRPEPPASYRLGDDELEEWRRVVNAMPANWFAQENYGVLAEYCRLVVSSRDFSERIRAIRKVDGCGATALAKEQFRTSQLIKQYASKLCIASRGNQSTAKAERANRQQMENRIKTVQTESPWDKHGAPPVKAGKRRKQDTAPDEPWVARRGRIEAAE